MYEVSTYENIMRALVMGMQAGLSDHLLCSTAFRPRRECPGFHSSKQILRSTMK
jgi:hypothetical protein